MKSLPDKDELHQYSKEDLVDMLRNDAQAWNQLRKEKPSWVPELENSRLQDADLRGADLCRCILYDADFSRSCLSGATIISSRVSRAIFERADMSNANLSDSHFLSADFRFANLSGVSAISADFRGSNFAGTNLERANLSKSDLCHILVANERGTRANLSHVVLREARFSQEGEGEPAAGFLDLAAAIGLETADFGSPMFLVDYLDRAFAYMHQPDLPEAKWPGFIRTVLSNIQAIRRIYGERKVPEVLVRVVQQIDAEIMRYLKRNPRAIHELRPRQFEELVAELLAGFGWVVQLTPATKDGGYDIFAITKGVEGLQSSWIIECKKYSLQNKVEVNVARELYAVKTDLRVANAMLATTSHFTKGVKDFKASRYDFELRDYEALIDWIDTYRPSPQGKLYIQDNQLILPGERIS